MRKAQVRSRVKYDLNYEYQDEVEFECPKRGKVTQKVTVKRYKSTPVPEPITY